MNPLSVEETIFLHWNLVFFPSTKLDTSPFVVVLDPCNSLSHRSLTSLWQVRGSQDISTTERLLVKNPETDPGRLTTVPKSRWCRAKVRPVARNLQGQAEIPSCSQVETGWSELISGPWNSEGGEQGTWQDFMWISSPRHQFAAALRELPGLEPHHGSDRCVTMSSDQNRKNRNLGWWNHWWIWWSYAMPHGVSLFPNAPPGLLVDSAYREKRFVGLRQESRKFCFGFHRSFAPSVGGSHEEVAGLVAAAPGLPKWDPFCCNLRSTWHPFINHHTYHNCSSQFYTQTGFAFLFFHFMILDCRSCCYFYHLLAWRMFPPDCCGGGERCGRNLAL